MDTIRIVLDKLEIQGKEREEINDSIAALKILRNKASHGWPHVSDKELKSVQDVNLPIELDDQGMLTFKVNLYVPIIQWLENFFEKLFSSNKIKISDIAKNPT